jgi:hypothetical protein
MNIKIEQSQQGLSEKEISSFEEKIERSIPKDYRDFLKKHNGGFPIPRDFSLKKGDRIEEISVEFFLGINLPGRFDIGINIDRYKNRTPDFLFPVALVGEGSLICISENKDKYGEIYFWDYEYEDEYSSKNLNNIALIASNFESFINNLH